MYSDRTPVRLNFMQSLVKIGILGGYTDIKMIWIEKLAPLARHLEGTKVDMGIMLASMQSL